MFDSGNNVKLDRSTLAQVAVDLFRQENPVLLCRLTILGSNPANDTTSLVLLQLDLSQARSLCHHGHGQDCAQSRGDRRSLPESPWFFRQYWSVVPSPDRIGSLPVSRRRHHQSGIESAALPKFNRSVTNNSPSSPGFTCRPSFIISRYSPSCITCSPSRSRHSDAMTENSREP